MALDIYFKRDIANVLRSTACASEGSAGLVLELVRSSELTRSNERAAGAVQHEAEIPPERLLQAYREGVAHALVSVGLAFGLEPVGANAPPGDGRPGNAKQGKALPLTGLLWVEPPHES
jgi:hypothetical protein